MSTLSFVLHRDANGHPLGDPFSAYITANSDITSVAGIEYHLAIDPAGRWKILKVDTNNLEYRLCTGVSDFATAWQNRQSLGYDYPFKTGW